MFAHISYFAFQSLQDSTIEEVSLFVQRQREIQEELHIKVKYCFTYEHMPKVYQNMPFHG